MGTIFALLSVLLVILVIIAGGVVRSTGSGMGCPDWPKCFGLLIPPTHIGEVQFVAGKEYPAGSMVIDHDTLWVANTRFVSGEAFDRKDWHRYPKHDYAVFNPAHTWTEYINRLVGVLCGFAILGMTIFSFLSRREHPGRFWLSILSLVLTVFQAWIGAKVVDLVLAGWMVTIHMFLAIVILFLLQWIHVHYITHGLFRPRFSLPNAGAIAVLCAQVLLGTRVREAVDDALEQGVVRGGVLEAAGRTFSIHSVFYLAALATIGYWIYPHLKKGKIRQMALSVGLSLVLLTEVLSGFLLKVLDLPFWLQPVHLVLANVALCLAFYLFCLEYEPEGKTSEPRLA